jgi:putative membrane protein
MARQLSEQDRNFILEARPMGLAEVKMSQLARDYALRSEVRKFAERMIKEHGEANKKLMKILRKTDLDAPDEPDEEHQELMDQLYELEGEEFDKEYVRTQVKDHEHHLELYEREARQGEDPDVKEFAKACVPLLQQHLTQVKGLASTLQV